MSKLPARRSVLQLFGRTLESRSAAYHRRLRDRRHLTLESLDRRELMAADLLGPVDGNSVVESAPASVASPNANRVDRNVLKEAVHSEVKQIVAETIKVFEQHLDDSSLLPYFPAMPSTAPIPSPASQLTEIETQRTHQLAEANSKANDEAAQLASTRDQVVISVNAQTEAALQRAQEVANQQTQNAIATANSKIAESEQSRDEAIRQAEQAMNQGRVSAETARNNAVRAADDSLAAGQQRADADRINRDITARNRASQSRSDLRSQRSRDEAARRSEFKNTVDRLRGELNDQINRLPRWARGLGRYVDRYFDAFDSGVASARRKMNSALERIAERYESDLNRVSATLDRTLRNSLDQLDSARRNLSNTRDRLVADANTTLQTSIAQLRAVQNAVAQKANGDFATEKANILRWRDDLVTAVQGELEATKASLLVAKDQATRDAQSAFDKGWNNVQAARAQAIEIIQISYEEAKARIESSINARENVGAAGHLTLPTQADIDHMFQDGNADWIDSVVDSLLPDHAGLALADGTDVSATTTGTIGYGPFKIESSVDRQTGESSLVACIYVCAGSTTGGGYIVGWETGVWGVDVLFDPEGDKQIGIGGHLGLKDWLDVQVKYTYSEPRQGHADNDVSCGVTLFGKVTVGLTWDIDDGKVQGFKIGVGFPFGAGNKGNGSVSTEVPVESEPKSDPNSQNNDDAVVPVS